MNLLKKFTQKFPKKNQRKPETESAQIRFLKSHKRNKRIIYFSQVLILFLFLFSWEFSANHKVIDSFIFSSPSRIILCFYEMILDKTIFLHLWYTLYETILSFLLVTVFSIFAAILLWGSKKLSQILEPYLVVLNSLPKSALAPLLIVWLGANQKTIIVAGMSVAIFGSILNLYTVFSSINKEDIKLIYTLGGKKHHTLTKVVLPSSIPSIISNMKVNIGLCLVGVIIGEFLAARSGLGYLIIYSSQVFKMDWLLMAIVLLCMMAFILYSLISILEKWCQKRY